MLVPSSGRLEQPEPGGRGDVPLVVDLPQRRLLFAVSSHEGLWNGWSEREARKQRARGSRGSFRERISIRGRVFMPDFRVSLYTWALFASCDS